MKYSDEFIARVLGAINEGLPHKVVARVAGIPLGTVQSISKRERRATVSPDDSIRHMLQESMKGN